jgi:L-alanine-DL-glutamate epimerase-like enolase superfamily enzyme
MEGGMKITEVEAICLNLPEKKDIADSSQDAVIVKVHTDEGIVGIGEIDSHPPIVKAILEAPMSHRDSHGVVELLVGEDPFDRERLWQKVYKKITHYGRRGVGIQVMGGIDIALWDIAGKACNRPIHKLLGGCFRDKLPAYASALFPEDPREIVKMIVGFVGKGFKGVKFGWGAFGREADRDIELVKAAREAVGEEIKLLVDAGEQWDASTAIERAKKLEEYNPFFLEDPLSPDDIDGYAKLTRATALRIAAGEAETTRFPYRDLIEKGNVDVIQPDVTRVGGISEAQKIAWMACDRGVMFVPHAWSTDILVAATLHVLAALPQESLLEFCVSNSPLKRDLLLEPFGIDNDGFVKVPEKPGLGIELNEEIIEKFSKQ